MYTDYQAEHHLLLASGEPPFNSADALIPAPDLASAKGEERPVVFPPEQLAQHPPRRPA